LFFTLKKKTLPFAGKVAYDIFQFATLFPAPISLHHEKNNMNKINDKYVVHWNQIDEANVEQL
jgi:hypothetical protein